jgi:hypothetical protein
MSIFPPGIFPPPIHRHSPLRPCLDAPTTVPQHVNPGKPSIPSITPTLPRGQLLRPWRHATTTEWEVINRFDLETQNLGYMLDLLIVLFFFIFLFFFYFPKFLLLFKFTVSFPYWEWILYTRMGVSVYSSRFPLVVVDEKTFISLSLSPPFIRISKQNGRWQKHPHPYI